MYFIRRKKHQKDQDAGLIFHWRGFRKHHSGKMIALLMACGLFAFSVYAIKIETVKSPLQSKKEGVVFMLNEDNPDVGKLLIQVVENSPFPLRWDPALDDEVSSRIAEDRNQLDGKLWNYEMRMQSLPAKSVANELLSIAESNNHFFFPSHDKWRDFGVKNRFVDQEDPVIRVRVMAGDQLKPRISGDQLQLPNELIVDEGYGQIFRFQIALDSAGFVSNCMPLPGGSADTVIVSDRQKDLASWLRSQRFKEDEQGGDEMIVGEVELQIEALRK